MKFITLLFFGLMVVSTAVGQTVSGIISDAAKQPIIGASVEVLNSSLGTISDEDGQYSVVLPPGQYKVRFLYLGYIPVTKDVTISSGSLELNVTMEEDILGLNEIVVIGTRGGERTVINSPVPVDIIGSKDLRSSGATQTIQAIQNLVPSYSVTKPSITDGSDHFRPATLRGLGPDQVLILVNGKRRHTSALVHVNGTVGRGSTGVDINSIPSSAIERIEVLRDGASAQYGSDAIAGVINIILKKDAGFDFEMSTGSHFTNFEKGYKPGEGLFDGITNQSLQDNNGPLFSFDYLTKVKKELITDGQRVNLHVGKGFNIGKGNYYLSGQYRLQGRTNRQGDDVRINYFSGDSRENSFDRTQNFRYGDSKFNDFSVFLNGESPLSDNTSFYLFGGGNYRDGLSGCFFRRASDSRTIRSIYPDGFLPLINAKLTDLSLGAGLKGKIGSKWNYDLSEVIGTNAFRLDMKNTHNTSLGNIGAFSFPDKDIQQKTEMYDGTLHFTQATTNFDMNRSFPSNFASPLNLALGAELKFENYKISPGEISSYYDGNAISGGVQDGPNKGSRAAAGCQCFPGWKDNVSDSRSSMAIYSELETQPTKGWTTSVAGRLENFSDFGLAANGKFATRIELSPIVALRGAISTGFRAPSLGQSNYSAIQTTTLGTSLIETGFFPVGTKIAKALGATDLKAEKSVNLSGGITFNAKSFALTIDGYQINIRDRVILSEQFAGIERNGVDLLEQYLIGQGLSAAQGAYFTNALNTRTRGLDIIARYGIDAGKGRMKFILSGNFNSTKITNKDEVTTPAALKQYSETPLLGELEFNRFENATPRNSFNFSTTYDASRFNALVRFIRYGSVRSGDYNDFGNIVYQRYGAKVSTDLELGWKLSSASSVYLGSNNLFDVYPDKSRKDLAFNGIFQYDGTSPIGFNGRYVYARLTYNLKK
ncbi:MAG: TonB-dependent receptor [Saprospiraceae bacterium]|jgi:iron complex outermembrane receptor protein|nr:TonB-dependent receptor [Saprospiraceae bacterium]MBK6478124.1 TonB-dependent receptor [Saprospiraceae bacterium]